MKEEDTVGSDRFEEFLHEIMQEGGQEQAPAGFTQQVMAQITAPQAAPAKSRWKPVISWRGWVGIAASLTLAILLIMRLPWASSTKSLPGKAVADKAIDATMDTLGSLQFQFPWTVAMCMAALFLLFALDRFVIRKLR